uniref:Syntaxin-18_N domain-containing protein n=1 Tax=Gongylonema pulchrum TaxID=637853 RepID=A0A183EB75_9BILA
LIHGALASVAEEHRKQHRELNRIDAVLALFGELHPERSTSGPAKHADDGDSWMDRPVEFRKAKELRDAVNEYTALLQRLSTKKLGSFEQRHSGSLAEQPRSVFIERTQSSLQCSDMSLRSRLAMINTTTVQIAPRPYTPDETNSIKSCCFSTHAKSQEILQTARQSVMNRKVHSASEHGSLMQLIKPASNLLRPPHPFLLSRVCF